MRRRAAGGLTPTMGDVRTRPVTAAFLRAVIRDADRHVRRRAKVDEIERTGGQRDS